jgi:peptidyl-tRNA hydrolase, PTH1 family
MNLFRLLSAVFKKNRLDGCRFIILGIGNIGGKYAGTRHNVGFCVVDAISRSLNNVKRFVACASEVTTGEAAGIGKIALIKPQTFVNRSGQAAAESLRAAGLSSQSLLVAVDDLNLPLGRLRVRKNGSDGGHNGLKSIIETIGMDFPRIRLGIGPVPKGMSTVDFVLSAFPANMQEPVDRMTVTAAEAAMYCLENGAEAAMNKYNRN